MKNLPAYLYAKVTDKKYTRTVKEHNVDVYKVAKLIWKEVKDYLEKIFDRDYTNRLEKIYYAAALGHDIGKASSSFATQLNRAVNPDIGSGERYIQPIRHELGSALCLWSDKFAGTWLRNSLPDDEYWLLIFTILSHHLKINTHEKVTRTDNVYSGYNPLLDRGLDTELTFYYGHSDIRYLLKGIAKQLSIPDPPHIPTIQFKLGLSIPEINPPFTKDDTFENIKKEFCNACSQSWGKYKDNHIFVHQLAILKLLLMCADAWGSAKNIDDCERAIPDLLNWAPNAKEIEDTIQRGLKGNPIRKFQQRIRKCGECGIVIAPCGSGKTTAAYLWAQENAPNKKLIFAYPTTGTTSQGFESYLYQENDFDRALIHSRSKIDIRAMMLTPSSHEDENRQKIVNSLDIWKSKVICCTVDTVLGVTQNWHRSITLTPVFLKSAIIFDEVHNYDNRLFASLLSFIRIFPHIPVLIMSASLSASRIDELKKALNSRNPQVIYGDKESSQIKRYEVHWKEDTIDLLSIIEEGIKNNKRILWVCNTVDRAVNLYLDMKSALGHLTQEVYLYHSRFMYEDRVKIQKKIVNKLSQDQAQGVLCITTQVCEMSLDLDAHILITENCPFPSLVQRLGRLARFATKESESGQCFIYPPENERPYTDNEKKQFEVSEKYIKKVNGKKISQDNLTKVLQRLKFSDIEDIIMCWTDCGWESYADRLRKHGHTITIVREEELEKNELNYEKCTMQDVTAWTIPLLIRSDLNKKLNIKVGPYRLAKKGDVIYDNEIGGRWANQSQ